MSKMQTRLINADEFELWDKFVEKSPQGNIFNKSFWLKLVCSNFQIWIVEENGSIIGGIVLPNIKNKIFTMPKLTPQLGLLLGIENNNIKYNKTISRSMSIANEIIKILPKNALKVDYNFSVNYSNMLPFIWDNYNVGLRYTYIINEISNLDKVFDNFDYSIKSEIKKSEKNNIKISSKFGVEEFYKVNNLTFERQGAVIPYTFEFIKRLDVELKNRDCRDMLFAINDNNEIIAGVYIIYDNNTAYYLMGGADPNWRKYGIQSHLIWEAIKLASRKVKYFDFEGSMVQSIESYFRKFGGIQTPIYSIDKSNKVYNCVYKFGSKHKNIIRKLGFRV